MKVGPGPRDPGPFSKFKRGTRDPPLRFESETQGPPQSLKVGLA